MNLPIAVTGYAVTAEADRVTRKLIQIPAATALTCLYALADQDGWTGGFMWRTSDGTEVALEEHEIE
jgi:hypothetical protein